MGMNDFASGNNEYGAFIVRNISPQKKTINIFNYPINLGCTRDLLQIPGVGENDIKSALMKGQIRNKFKAGDIELVYSDIDLLQFNDLGIQYLDGYGFITGVLISYDQLSVIQQQNISLVGAIDGINTTFYIPSGTFIYTYPYTITVYWDGVRQNLDDDYILGPPVGAEYNSIIFTVPPDVGDTITADYYIQN
jgi:hypothetical protein